MCLAQIDHPCIEGFITGLFEGFQPIFLMFFVVVIYCWMWQVNNPASGNVIASIARMGERETKDAIGSAYDAFTHWSKLTAANRSSHLRNWYNLLIKHKEELGQLITLEQGKPLKESIGEVTYGASFIEYFAEEAKRVYGDIIPSPLPDRRLFVLKQPVGVVAAITPWNFPLAMITRKVGPALACGCTVVIKPSELTPLTALAAAELALQSGIPPGVLNVVMGDATSIGTSLLESPQVRKITFTGSTAVGKKLMAGAADTVKKVSLELGGNAPCIIFDDADLEVALKGSLATKFLNTGQTCVCANRILVQEGIYEKFTSAFSKAVQDLKVGNGFSEGVVQALNLNYCDQISDSGLDCIRGLSNLTSLSFKRNNNITAEGLSALSGLVNLLHLDLERCPLIHGGLVHLRGLSKLQALNINCCNCITNSDMEPLAELVNLTELQLSASKETDHGITFFKVKAAVIKERSCPKRKSSQKEEVSQTEVAQKEVAQEKKKCPNRSRHSSGTPKPHLAEQWIAFSS